MCSAHFLEKDIVLYDEYRVNGEIVKIPRDRAALRQGALPLLFNKYPKCFQPKIPNQREPPAKRNIAPAKKLPQNTQTTTESVLPQREENIHPPIFCEELPQISSIDLSQNNPPQQKDQPDWNHKDAVKLQLPLNWVVCNTSGNDAKVLAHIDPATIQINKSIKFQESSVNIVLRGSVQFKGDVPQKINTCIDAQKLVNKIDMMNVCKGTGLTGKPFSVGCNGSAGTKAKTCRYCVAEREKNRKKDKRKKVVKQRLEEKRAKRKQMLQSMKRSKTRLFMKVRTFLEYYNFIFFLFLQLT